MKRRTLLGNSITLPACLTSIAAAQKSRFLAGRVKIGVKYNMILEPKLSVEDKFRLLADLGFNGLEVHSWAEPEIHLAMEKATEKTRLPIQHDSWHHWRVSIRVV